MHWLRQHYGQHFKALIPPGGWTQLSSRFFQSDLYRTRFGDAGSFFELMTTREGAHTAMERTAELVTFTGEQLLQALTAPLEQRSINFGLDRDHPRPEPIIDNNLKSQSGQVRPASKDTKLETNTAFDKLLGSTSIVPAGKFLPRQ
jgi:hypothetical protein